MENHAAENVALSLLVMFVSAKLFAEIFERLKQPGIAGEILAGVLIGPHMLGWASHNEVAVVLGELGVMFLLFRVGLEVKSSDLIAVGGRATLIALAGVLLPFAMGWGLATWWGLQSIESIFIGAAMVATSVGITAQVLSVGGWISQRATKLILAAAVIDDVLGLLVLAAVSSMAQGSVSYVDLGITAALAGGFTLLILLVGARVMRHVVPKVHRGMRAAEAEFTVALGLMFALSLLATYAGVAAIIGAFLAGMALSEVVEHRVHLLTDGVTTLLVPFFLVDIGLNFDISAFGDRSSMIFAGLVLIAAVVSKLAGCALAAAPLGRRDAVRIGIGMIPRGEVGLVFAAIGTASGVLDKPLQAAIIIMVILTTFLAPPFLRLAFGKTQKSEELAEQVKQADLAR
jgi:Kef-type K+ transport system membrane component KefB